MVYTDIDFGTTHTFQLHLFNTETILTHARIGISSDGPIHIFPLNNLILKIFMEKFN